MVILNKYKKIQEDLGIIGESEAIRELVELVMSIAPTNVTVMITGESGSGKEVFARAIHQLSPRKNKNMLSVNCGAIPEGLLESELFGHEKGSFTGAVATKKGFFELTDNGTIFLDEIGEMPIQTQVKLLRVLETGELMRVGSGEIRNVDVRVIAATHRDLARMVQQKLFRKDLYYRLKAVTMFLPPLRDRREDIPQLIKKFSKDLVNSENISFEGFSDEALEILTRYHWPGNVRELRNFVETIIILSRGQHITARMVREQLTEYEEPVEVSTALPMPLNITREDAERELVYKALVSMGLELKELKSMMMQFFQRNSSGYRDNVVYSPMDSGNGNHEIKPLDEVERELIEKALHKFNGNRRKVAKALNISERTLYRKIKDYDLNRDDDYAMGD